MAEKDQTLIEKTLAGDSSAFGDLVERYARLVRGVIWEAIRRPDEVEDLVQEVFSQAYENLATLRQPAKFAAWLWQIATNAAMVYHRKQKLAASAAESVAALAVHLRRPDEVVEADETIRLMWEALDRLAPDYRRLLVLYYFEGCEQREIARFLGLSPAVVRWRLYKARKKLSDELRSKLEDKVDEQFDVRRRLRVKVMALLPVAVVFQPQPRPWLERWMPWKYWALGTAAGLGIGGLAYQLSQAPAAQPSREALRLEQQARLHAEPSIEWEPPRPRAGQQVRIKVEDLEVEEGNQAELHLITDPEYPLDQVVPMQREGSVWAAALELPEQTKGVFFFIAPRAEGPQSLQNLRYDASLTIQKLLRRYCHSLLVYDGAGSPVKGAIHSQALLAQKQGHPLEEVLAWTDRELSLYPDNFAVYLTRWKTMSKAGHRSPEILAQLRAEQEALRDSYPDRPEVLWQAAQVNTSWQDSLRRELDQHFPEYDRADEAAYLRVFGTKFRGRSDADHLAALEEFLRRYPNSAYVDEAYGDLLEALAQTSPGRAAELADSLIDHTLVLPYDAAKEEHQKTPIYSGHGLPEGFAYRLRFELFLREGRQEEALSLVHRLVASGLRDPWPYLHLGQHLAGQDDEPFIRESPVVFPRDLSLAIQVLEAGLPLATAENLLELPGFNPLRPGPDYVRSGYHQLSLEGIYTVRQAFLQALAECHLVMNEYPLAIHRLEEAAGVRAKISTYPMIGDRTSLLLGKGYERLGRWEDAEQAYLRVVAQDYSNPEAETALRRLHQERYGHLDKLQPLLRACRSQAPEFVLKDTLGQEIHLADFKGRPLLLYYDGLENSAFTAELIIAQMETLKKGVEKYQQQGLEVLHIRRMPGVQHSPFRLALDDDGVLEKYQLSRFCALVLIDQEGRRCLRHEFWGGEKEEGWLLQLQQKIEELLKEGTAEPHVKLVVGADRGCPGCGM